jgi:hypothetical protein
MFQEILMSVLNGFVVLRNEIGHAPLARTAQLEVTDLVLDGLALLAGLRVGVDIVEGECKHLEPCTLL